jgi:hypothetical protein
MSIEAGDMNGADGIGPSFEPHPQPLDARLLCAILDRADVTLSGDDVRAAAVALTHTAISMTTRGADDAHRVIAQLHLLANLLDHR